MLAEALRRLDRLSNLTTYRYIGFGSPFFADFSLFHKSLGIAAMISMERQVGDEDRFKFNRPFECIELEFGESSEILPNLDWTVRSFVWLDYDKRLLPEHLTDIVTVVSRAAPLSAVVVTVNADPGEFRDRARKLRSRLPNLVPIEASDASLGSWGTASTFRGILNERIEIALQNRNHGRPKGSQVHYRQIFNFHYDDGSRMLTVGGVLFDEGQRASIDQCRFIDFDFVRLGEESCLITVPNITPKEVRALNEALPFQSTGSVSQPGLAAEDVETYSRIYRYFPAYVDAEY
jgi:hypothetical protein